MSTPARSSQRLANKATMADFASFYVDDIDGKTERPDLGAKIRGEMGAEPITTTTTTSPPKEKKRKERSPSPATTPDPTPPAKRPKLILKAPKRDDAAAAKVWSCANRNCNTEMTAEERDGKDGKGRKVISNFFGRNKKETGYIDKDVWHTYCRKCYQRHTYRVHPTPTDKLNYFIDNIEMQLKRLELWRPDAKFKVQLTKGARDRLANYHTERSRNGGNDLLAAQHVEMVPKRSSKGDGDKPLPLEYGFPINLLDQFSRRFCTSKQFVNDYGNLATIMAWIKNLATNQLADYMPPMEFLICKAGDTETVNDPESNYDAWIQYETEQDAQRYEKPPADVEVNEQTDVSAPTAFEAAQASPSHQPLGLVIPTIEPHDEIPEFVSYYAGTPTEDRISLPPANNKPPSHHTSYATHSIQPPSTIAPTPEEYINWSPNSPLAAPPPGRRWTPWGWYPCCTKVGLTKADGTLCEPVWVIKERWARVRAAQDRESRDERVDDWVHDRCMRDIRRGVGMTLGPSPWVIR